MVHSSSQVSAVVPRDLLGVSEARNSGIVGVSWPAYWSRSMMMSWPVVSAVLNPCRTWVPMRMMGVALGIDSFWVSWLKRSWFAGS